MTCEQGMQVEQLLHRVATEGKLSVTWEELKVCIVEALKSVYLKYEEKNTAGDKTTSLYNELESLVRSCHRAPFTIQRICELLLNPVYANFEKFSYAFEKLFHVVSSVSEGEGIFTRGLLYLGNQSYSDWHADDSESSRSSTDTEILADSDNSTTAVSDLQQDNLSNGVEEDDSLES